MNAFLELPILAQIMIACVAGSAVSLAIAGFVAFRVKAHWIPTFVSFAVGALLGAVFLDILPHIFEETKRPERAAAFILAGILAFFVLEKLMLWRHHHHGEEGVHEHDHGRSGWMIVVGDSFHNFTDGVIIASTFLADVKVGVVTALAIIAHEIPQEIGDFLVLLHSGFHRRKALVLNAVSGLAMVLGALLGFFMLRDVVAWIPEILAIAAASMIYVAVADLIPGLHRRTALGESILQVAFIAFGIALIGLIHAMLFPHV
ncbi:MAG TPA: ZIP family metal transporter [Usitatibacter sp.]|nr:ZIP family metal transporter [Usitatibacter sp.]